VGFGNGAVGLGWGVEGLGFGSMGCGVWGVGCGVRDLGVRVVVKTERVQRKSIGHGPSFYCQIKQGHRSPFGEETKDK
jgi:hypothetical protein